MVGAAAQRGGQNRRRKDADSVSTEVLDEPGYRSKDGGAAVTVVKQGKKGLLGTDLVRAGGTRQADALRVLRLAPEEPDGRLLGRVMRPAYYQPAGAFSDEEAADSYY